MPGLASGLWPSSTACTQQTGPVAAIPAPRLRRCPARPAAAAAAAAAGHRLRATGPSASPRPPRDAALAATGSTAAVGGQEPVVGVVIVDHGSRKAESNDMLFEFADLFRQVTGRTLVEVSHMELAEPTIEQAVGRCAAAGATLVIIAPYFLSRGRHIQHDIPALVEQAAAAHPTVECVIAEPIGIDTLMAQLIDNRVAAAEAQAAGGAAHGPAAAATAPAAAGPS